MAHKIAFNTANLVGRVSNYRFQLRNWGDQHKKTVAQTNEKTFAEICRDIQTAGFSAVEIWAAHVDPSVMTEGRALAYRKILADHGLTLIGFAGGYNKDTLRVCQWLDITAINGGFWGGAPLEEIERLARSSGVRFNYENHPEKSAAEVIEKIKGGSEMIGAAIDTGWFGTHGADVVDEIKTLGKLVRHVHVKDVKAGTHETCPLGTGGINMPGIIAQLKSMGYPGWYSWEDEPKGRNPLDIAAESRLWIQKQLSAA